MVQLMNHCHRKTPHLLPHLNPDWFLPFLVLAYPGCPGKDAGKRFGISDT